MLTAKKSKYHKCIVSTKTYDKRYNKPVRSLCFRTGLINKKIIKKGNSVTNKKLNSTLLRLSKSR